MLVTSNAWVFPDSRLAHGAVTELVGRRNANLRVTRRQASGRGGLAGVRELPSAPTMGGC